LTGLITRIAPVATAFLALEGVSYLRRIAVVLMVVIGM
jgi:hypothetical protein